MAKAAKSKPEAVTPSDKIVELGRKLFALKEDKADLEEQLTHVNEEIKTLATVDLAKLMEESGVEKISLEGCGTVYLSQDFFASVNKDDRPKLYEWMKENGYGDIIVDWVFPQTLTAFAKEITEKNLPLPDMMKSYYTPVAKTRKS